MTTISGPLSAAQALRVTIQNARKETEETRRLAPQIVKGLIETGLCRLAVPASLGGHEAAPVVALEVYEELAGAEASVAWIAWNNSLPCLLSCHLSDSVRTELFGTPSTLFANSTRPSGRAIVVDDGVRVSGRWSLVSGCELADWIPVMCVITEGTEPRMLASLGVPELRMAYVPKGSYRILDTWYVGGLRGTGSHDVVIEDVFVPAERTFSFLDPKHLDRPLYRMPWAAMMSAGCAAMCLGIAQTAIDTLLELSLSKPQVGPGPGIRDQPAVQAMVAASIAEVDAARLFLHHTLGDVWAACNQGTPITEGQRARLVGAAHHAATTAKAVVTAMYEGAGTSALYVDCPLERAHRDIYAVTQHVILARRWLEDAGRVRLGLKPMNPLF
jgi:alkylation response protein AidB-like acyl-CoA dehydrogenase